MSQVQPFFLSVDYSDWLPGDLGLVCAQWKGVMDETERSAGVKLVFLEN
jgi:hypothetical protein